MTTGVARFRHCGDREVYGREEERGGQTVDGVVGREENEGGSGSRSARGTGCCINSI